MAITVAHDSIHANVSHLPAGQSAGYTTGSPDIRWTPADWAAHPGAVRIDQDAASSDLTADVLDVENGAATNGEAAHWYRMAQGSWDAGTRPGQRLPAIYTSASNVTPLVDALKAGGVDNGPRLWVARWDFSQANAIAEIVAASGPYPIIGAQFAPGTFYDTNMFSSTWLREVSMVPVHVPPAAPRQVEANGQQSWRELANAHGCTVVHSLTLTVLHNQPNGFSQPRQAAYVAAGDWNAPLPGPSGNTPGVRIWVG
jgi:hypothetical protein